MLRAVGTLVASLRLEDYVLPFQTLNNLGTINLVIVGVAIYVSLLFFFSPTARKIIKKFLFFSGWASVYDELKEYYADRTSYPQTKKSILGTYALGGILTGVAIFLLVDVLILSLTILAIFIWFLLPLLLITLPLVFGYFTREMGWVIHSERSQTLLEDPFAEDRPAFSDFPSMYVDGVKFGGLVMAFVVYVFGIWYVFTGVLDVPLDFGQAASLATIPAVIGFFLGLTVFPALLARFGHVGELGSTVANSTRYLRAVITDRTYLREVALGSSVIGATLLFIVLASRYSILLVPIFAFPLAFIAILQGLDHYARGYWSAAGISVEPDRISAKDVYAIPFRDGGVATPDRDRSILVLGETGSGKTEAIKLLVYQFMTEDEDPFVVFDYKGDYRRFFNEQRTAADGGSSIATKAGADQSTDGPGASTEPDLIRLSLEGSTHYWNIFREVESEEEFEEIGRALFAGREEEANNPYFPQAARQVFVAILKVIYREEDDPTNEFLINTFEQNSAEDLYTILTDYDEFSGVASNLNPDAPRQAAGVYGHLQTMMTEIFKGDFREPGEFSIREYMANPDGRRLILDFPIDRGESVKPVYRFYIDWAIRFGLDDPTRDAYFLLDEFQTIPGLERIERLVNAGRGRNAYGILGLQSKAQLHSTYGEKEGDAIVSGLAQEILLRPGDSASVEHIRSRTGQVQRKRLVQGPGNLLEQATGIRSTVFSQITTEEDYEISEAELQQFEPGEAIVLQESGWRRGRLYQLHEIREYIDQWRARRLKDVDLDAVPAPEEHGESLEPDSEASGSPEMDAETDTTASSADTDVAPDATTDGSPDDASPGSHDEDASTSAVEDGSSMPKTEDAQ